MHGCRARFVCRAGIEYNAVTFTRDKLTLFWSITPDALDFANLERSGAARVMLAWGCVTPGLLARLTAIGRRVVIRLSDDDTNMVHPALLAANLRQWLQAARIDAVIVGCEPNAAFDMTYGSVTWGQNYAFPHASHVGELAEAVNGLGMGILSVSPALKMGAISEDDKPQPGQTAWQEICRPAYEGHCQGNGAHIYGYGWTSVVDSVRARFALQRAQEAFHLPAWIDEAGFAHGTPVERMRAVLDFGTLLLNHPLGQRVEMLCPFVANGTPGGQWDPNYLMRDPACYDLLRDWLAG